tara:strand:+ start:459 stop:752 length:294 start_codon:yes stop_codon:yes gene_type:complete
MYRPLPKEITIKKSKIDGLGLFAIEDIPKDTSLGLSHVKVNGEYIRTPLGGFYNHSDDPNCETHIDTIGKNMFLLTIKDIKKGEELTAKYTLYKIST